MSLFKVNIIFIYIVGILNKLELFFKSNCYKKV